MKLTWLLAGLAVTMTSLAAETVWLSSLDLSQMRQGWGTPQVNHSVTKKPLTIDGHLYARGVGTHATSQLWVYLGGATERFQARVGVDDDAGSSRASVVFRVYADGHKLWDSGVMHWKQPAKTVDVPLNGDKTLLLQVTDAEDGNGYDHADWAQARFLVSGAAPKAISAPEEKAVILTPPSGPQPRLHGPVVYGCRPGNPFLYRIPATGTRPMRFAAVGLPASLHLNPTTGIITGRVEARGSYPVTLEASNHLGNATRPFKIVCGDTLSLTPYMGWNSWYVWESRVTDHDIRAAADAMISSGMADHGYQYVNIDDCWAVKPGSKDPNWSGAPRNAEGMVNANRRFPNMKALTAYIHAKGLKAGIYTSPGPLTCAGCVGAYQHEALDAQRFVQWGFDFLKYDWCSYGRIAKNKSVAELEKPYRLMGRILRHEPRDIVFNLCQYGMGDVWKWGASVGGNSWRTAGDLGGSFNGIPAAIYRDGLDLYAAQHLYRYAGPGHWNDPDYLLLGYLSNWRGGTAPTPLTPNEQYTHMSFWCLEAAPLIFSGDMTRLDPFTLNILCNDEVIDVDQDPLGQAARRVARHGEGEVWARNLADGSKAVGLFNRGEFPTKVTVTWTDLGLHGRQRVRDLWRQRDLGRFTHAFSATVPRHGVVLVRMWKAD